ncbi:hypothetical protein RFI_33854, partial [Reticulomyxa filosa]
QQILLEEQHKDAEYRKKLKGQQGALLKTISPPESRHERLSIQKMKSAKEIIQYIKCNQFQHTSIYASAIKKCSELKNLMQSKLSLSLAKILFRTMVQLSIKSIQ